MHCATSTHELLKQYELQDDSEDREDIIEKLDNKRSDLSVALTRLDDSLMLFHDFSKGSLFLNTMKSSDTKKVHKE